MGEVGLFDDDSGTPALLLSPGVYSSFGELSQLGIGSLSSSRVRWSKPAASGKPSCCAKSASDPYMAISECSTLLTPTIIRLPLHLRLRVRSEQVGRFDARSRFLGPEGPRNDNGREHFPALRVRVMHSVATGAGHPAA